MNYEEKICELTKRVELLEKEENKRKLRKKLNIAIEVLKIVAVLIIILILYVNINNRIIKPYKEKVDYVENKVESVERFVQEKWDTLKRFVSF